MKIHWLIVIELAEITILWRSFILQPSLKTKHILNLAKELTGLHCQSTYDTANGSNLLRDLVKETLNMSPATPPIFLCVVFSSTTCSVSLVIPLSLHLAMNHRVITAYHNFSHCIRSCYSWNCDQSSSYLSLIPFTDSNSACKDFGFKSSSAFVWATVRNKRQRNLT